MDKILKQIELIKSWEGSKERPYYKVEMKRLRQVLYDMVVPLLEKQMHLVVGGYILEKWYDPPSNKTRCMIYTKESWNRKQERQREFNRFNDEY